MLYSCVSLPGPSASLKVHDEPWRPRRRAALPQPSVQQPASGSLPSAAEGKRAAAEQQAEDVEVFGGKEECEEASGDHRDCDVDFVDWELAGSDSGEDSRTDPKHYDFEVNDRVIFLEDSEEFDFDRHSVPVYRICKKCDSENTYNLWDVHEKKVVAEEIDGGCLKKVSKH
ncbi:hypothetical protein SLS57_011124 [Botryosphaeria dothidea]